MKTIVIFLLSLGFAWAQPVPAGVSAQRIQAEWVQPGVSYKDQLGENNVLDPGELTNVKVRNSKIIEFTNLGALGGAETARAVLINRWIALDGGEVYKSKGPNGWPIRPSQLASFPDEVFQLEFSGGPEGHFRSTDGRKFQGTLDLKHNSIALEVPGVNSWLLTITTPDAFKDWLNLTSNFDPSKSTSNFDKNQPQALTGVRFSSLSGEVETRPEGDGSWRFAKLNTPINRLDHVRTGEDSQAILGFPDLSTCVVGPESEVIVIYDPDRRESKLDLVCGNIWRNIKKMIKDGTMEVEMSQAVAGIKGTTLVCQQDGRGSTVKVLEGQVDLRSKAQPGQHVLLNPGQQATADGAGLSQVQTFLVESEGRQWAYATYQHPEGSLHFQYPALWTLRGNADGQGMDILSLTKGGKLMLEINRQSWALSKSLTLASARAAVQAQRPQAEAFESSLAGIPCVVFVEDLVDEIPVTLWNILLPSGGRIYYFAVCSPQVRDHHQLPRAFSGILDSLKF